MKLPPEMLRVASAFCRLDGCELENRLDEVAQFVSTATAVHILGSGVRLEFPRSGDNARAVVDFIRAEQECCPRFTYRIDDVAEHTITLEITADTNDVRALRRLYRTARLQ
jgi:hypothetical protein